MFWAFFLLDRQEGNGKNSNDTTAISEGNSEVVESSIDLFGGNGSKYDSLTPLINKAMAPKLKSSGLSYTNVPLGAKFPSAATASELLLSVQVEHLK